VQFYECGEVGGHLFYALELVDGGSLAVQLEGGPWRAKQAARFVRVLAEAVHHAHRRGIVHRDLKPSNVLLTRDGTPKVADFGLAREVDTSGCHTSSDAILGTPGYMAPEQAAGQSKRVGPKADVYALGAILYELVTGRRPFEGETRYEVIRQVVADDPVPPRVLRPDLPSGLETICLRCLRKDPKQRYPSAQALANDLRRFVSGESIRARRRRPWDGAVKWVRHNPGLAALIVAVACLFLLGLLVSNQGR
jgi:serine/threonine-protein kinase